LEEILIRRLEQAQDMLAAAMELIPADLRARAQTTKWSSETGRKVAQGRWKRHRQRCAEAAAGVGPGGEDGAA
jgi:hypothetical protein